MNKLVIPAILVSITLVAGIFAFMPVEKASTVHTTIQGTQLTEIASAIDLDTTTNATAGCGNGAGLVFYTFTNNTLAGVGGGLVGGQITSIVLDIDGGGGAAGITLNLGANNSTSVSGVIGVTANNVANFGFSSSAPEDRGDIHLTALCQVDGTAAADAN